MRKEYTGVTLPKKLAILIDQVIAYERFGYSSRSEFIKESIRKNLNEKQKQITKEGRA